MAQRSFPHFLRANRSRQSSPDGEAANSADGGEPEAKKARLAPTESKTCRFFGKNVAPWPGGHCLAAVKAMLALCPRSFVNAMTLIINRQPMEDTYALMNAFYVVGPLAWMLACSLLGLDLETAEPKEVTRAMVALGSSVPLWELHGPVCEFLFGLAQDPESDGPLSVELFSLIYRLADCSPKDLEEVGIYLGGPISTAHILHCNDPFPDIPSAFNILDAKDLLEQCSPDTDLQVTVTSGKDVRTLFGRRAMALISGLTDSDPSTTSLEEMLSKLEVGPRKQSVGKWPLSAFVHALCPYNSCATISIWVTAYEERAMCPN